MNPFSPQILDNLVAIFNQGFKPGDIVEVLRSANSDETFLDVIKAEAFVMGGHSAVVQLKDKGIYDLTFVKGLSSDTAISTSA